jgi:Sap, sulfolipid-1-addressing protein
VHGLRSPRPATESCARLWLRNPGSFNESTDSSRQGNVSAVWGSVLGVALLITLNPVRLGVILLMVSRPRPLQNLLAFGAGNLIVGVPAVLVPLVVLHVTPMFRSFVEGLGTAAAVATVRHIQIGMGMLALSIAALMIARSVMRARSLTRRQRMHLPTPCTTSTLVLDSNSPTAISQLPGRAQNAATEGESAIRRLLGRANNAWENGSLWVALVWGLCSVPVDSLFVVAIIVASGARMGTQVSAAIAFVVGWLASVEVILISHLATPAKTEAALRLLHDWSRAHRRNLVVAIFAVVGVSGLARGMGIV